MQPSEMEQAVLAIVRAPDYRPVKPRVIADQLNLPEELRHDLKRTIKRLVKQNQLAYGPNHLIVEPDKRLSLKGEVIGVFRRTERGFGFVRPAKDGTPSQPQGDVFIPAKKAGDASSGDKVRVRLSKSEHGRHPGPSGAIVEILERDTRQFVGTYLESGGNGYVDVDGTLFAQPISVGDPGAKNAQPGDKVVFEMVRFPSHLHGGEGVITEVLGPRGSPGVDTLSIIREYGLVEHFAADVDEAAGLEAEKFDESITPPRVDMTDLTTITIDPVDARDFDDAISLERIDRGHWRLGVHIADVAHFVRPGTALDREAKQRATSVYLPDRVIPMLPELISNGLASLQPDRVRYTRTAMIEFTPDGVRVAAEIRSSAIRSRRRFTYEEIDEYLADPAAVQSQMTPEVHALVGRMHELAMILRARRIKNGALELSMNEVRVELDRDGRVSGAQRVENTVSHQIIEEFMLSANEAVAETLAKDEIPFLRRVHENPDPRKLKQLTEFVKELGLATEPLESRFALQDLLGRVSGRPEQYAVNYAVLRSLQRAVYSPREEGHYALASDCYCHFTSPIRRYPDLTVHRTLAALELGKRPSLHFGELVQLGAHCSEQEQRAESAERELTKLKLLNYLSERIGDEMEAVITSVESYGFFAQGIELPAEGLVHISSLADDYYRYDSASHTLAGQRAGNVFRLGDVIRVVVARVDLERRQLEFRVVQRLARGDAHISNTRKATRRTEKSRTERIEPSGGKRRRANPRHPNGAKRRRRK